MREGEGEGEANACAVERMNDHVPTSDQVVSRLRKSMPVPRNSSIARWVNASL